MIPKAQRIQNLPPYLFAQIDKLIGEAQSRGVDVISFGIGDPDQPTPPNIVNKMIEKVQDPSTHHYPSYQGMKAFREAVAAWYYRHYQIELDPEREIVSLIGSKEGIAHLPLCFINPGDWALIPDPAYPVYKTAVLLAGGQVISLPLKAENNFLPDLDSIPEESARKAKLLYLNYPNNPTGATADDDFYLKAIDFAKKYNLILAHDAAYCHLGLDGYKPPSIMQYPGAKDLSIEFGSLSKPFNMTGWRIAWAVGKAEIIEALGTVKTNIDSGVFEAIQHAGIEALNNTAAYIQEVSRLYARRRDLLVKGLGELGWKIPKNKATFYLWAQLPSSAGKDSVKFSTYIFEKTGVFFTPGVGYGPTGEGFVRIALTVSERRIEEALQRFREAKIKF